MNRKQRLFLAAVGVAAVFVVVLRGPGSSDDAGPPAPRAATAAQDVADLHDSAHRAALEEALRSDPCGAPLAVYRLGFGGIWTVGHEDGRPPRVQVERLLGVRTARQLVERAEAMYARDGIAARPLSTVLPGCGRNGGSPRG